DPPVVDVAASRRMGLFVVGRLALRHGIRVQLRSQDAGGLTAMVLLPENLVVPIPGAFPGMPSQPVHAGPAAQTQSFAAGPSAFGGAVPPQGGPGPMSGPMRGPAPMSGAAPGAAA